MQPLSKSRSRTFLTPHMAPCALSQLLHLPTGSSSDFYHHELVVHGFEFHISGTILAAVFVSVFKC